MRSWTALVVTALLAVAPTQGVFRSQGGSDSVYLNDEAASSDLLASDASVLLDNEANKGKGGKYGRHHFLLEEEADKGQRRPASFLDEEANKGKRRKGDSPASSTKDVINPIGCLRCHPGSLLDEKVALSSVRLRGASLDDVARSNDLLQEVQEVEVLLNDNAANLFGRTLVDDEPPSPPSGRKCCTGFMPKAQCPGRCPTVSVTGQKSDCTKCHSHRFMPKKTCAQCSPELPCSKCRTHRFMPHAKCSKRDEYGNIVKPTAAPTPAPTEATTTAAPATEAPTTAAPTPEPTSYSSPSSNPTPEPTSYSTPSSNPTPSPTVYSTPEPTSYSAPPPPPSSPAPSPEPHPEPAPSPSSVPTPAPSSPASNDNGGNTNNKANDNNNGGASNNGGNNGGASNNGGNNGGAPNGSNNNGGNNNNGGASNNGGNNNGGASNGGNNNGGNSNGGSNNGGVTNDINNKPSSNTNTASATTTPKPTSSSSNSSSSKLSGGAIAGICIGALACAGAVGFFVWKKRKDQSREAEIFSDPPHDVEQGGDYAAM
ncbi:unnamed protein product [Aphanomyces euteiches]